MQLFVDHILAHYFDEMKAQLGWPLGQKALWQISNEFLNWMHEKHPNIFLDFVPAGCTGVVQPCDVGIQHPFKHIMN